MGDSQSRPAAASNSSKWYRSTSSPACLADDDHTSSLEVEADGAQGKPRPQSEVPRTAQEPVDKDAFATASITRYTLIT